MSNLSEFLNQLDPSELTEALMKCCGSQAWVSQMVANVPFENDDHVESVADESWNGLDRGDWIEAFSAHPRIGDVKTLRDKFSNTGRWASREQSGVGSADEQTIEDLAKLNNQYFDKFGYIFIICATGKSANEMRSALQERLPNDDQTELALAAAEQLKITLLRLRKLTK